MAAVYASGTLSLAVLELLVHLRIEEARKRYVALTLEWPNACPGSTTISCEGQRSRSSAPSRVQRAAARMPLRD